MLKPYSFSVEEIEDIILGMADVVYENQKLRRKLQEAEEYKKKYEDLIKHNAQAAADSSAALFSAIINGAFATPEERERRMVYKPMNEKETNT